MIALRTWTDEREEMLRSLCKARHPYSAIASLIGGVSRVACIGKANRLGIDNGNAGGRPSRGDTACTPKPRKRHNDGLIAAPRSPIDVTPKDEPEPIGPIHDFPPVGACRFIRAEVETKTNWRCCGADAPIFAKPYCDYHMAKVYR